MEFPEGSPRRTHPRLSMNIGYAKPLAHSQDPAAISSLFDPQFLVFRLEPEATPYIHLDMLSILNLTQRWREALVSNCNDLSSSVREIASGHSESGAPSERPHLAFLPLAFVGHEHADGHLLGMGFTLPKGLSREDRKGVLQAQSRVRWLLLGRIGKWRVELDSSSNPPWNLRPKTWTAYPAGATHWSSITPVVYDRHPKAKDMATYHEQASIMIRKACTNISLPEPREVIITAISAHLGTPPAHAFSRLRRKDNSERRHSHVILIFDKPVRGPVLIGAGRYRGYGFFRPLFNVEKGGVAP